MSSIATNANMINIIHEDANVDKTESCRTCSACHFLLKKNKFSANEWKSSARVRLCVVCKPEIKKNENEIKLKEQTKNNLYNSYVRQVVNIINSILKSNPNSTSNLNNQYGVVSILSGSVMALEYENSIYGLENYNKDKKIYHSWKECNDLCIKNFERFCDLEKEKNNNNNNNNNLTNNPKKIFVLSFLNPANPEETIELRLVLTFMDGLLYRLDELIQINIEEFLNDMKVFLNSEEKQQQQWDKPRASAFQRLSNNRTVKTIKLAGIDNAYVGMGTAIDTDIEGIEKRITNWKVSAKKNGLDLK